MSSGSRRAVRALSEKSFVVARALGQVLPLELKRFVFRLRPAAVTWDMREHGLVFVAIPKVAQTSMRAALAAHAAGALEVDANEAERWEALAVERYQINAYPPELRRLSANSFSFAFVRNPLDRLFSAYVNKVLAPVDPSMNLFERHGISPGMSFPDFVEAVLPLSEDRCDIHLRSQYRFISDREGVIVDYVGRFERLGSDWDVLRERFGLPALPKQNVSSERSYRDAYTPALARVVAGRYARDIELFGYEEEVAALAG